LLKMIIYKSLAIGLRANSALRFTASTPCAPGSTAIQPFAQQPHRAMCRTSRTAQFGRTASSTLAPHCDA